MVRWVLGVVLVLLLLLETPLVDWIVLMRGVRVLRGCRVWGDSPKPQPTAHPLDSMAPGVAWCGNV